MKTNIETAIELGYEEGMSKKEYLRTKPKSKKDILKRLAKSKAINRRILKKNRTAVRIKETSPAEYVSRFFNDEWEETKKSMFFK